MVRKNQAKSTPAAKPAAPSVKDVDPASSSTSIDIKHQQRLLDILSSSFEDVIASPSFPETLQEIKQALFHRDFATAFGKKEYLEAYAARWSPTRALCYASVLSNLRHHLDLISRPSNDTTVEATEAQNKQEGDILESSNSNAGGTDPIVGHPRSIKVLSIGGCAAEHVAFASYLNETALSGHITLVDAAPWSHVTSLLQTHLTTPPRLSKYASAAAKASNRALVKPSQLSIDFERCDALQLGKEHLHELLDGEPLLVTILFTLNELYTEGGIGKTTRFLGNLSQSLPTGSILLVLDSPGSYSEATIGKDKKRYPMQWLLDHTLLETMTTDCKWEKLESNDSIWFRLSEALSYPIQLENMRYQLHLYKIDRPAQRKK
jgi:25S rRNA (uracil2843-N3)-methyltransferase